MTDIDLDKLEALADEATPGEWTYRPHQLDDWGWVKSGKNIVATSRGDPADHLSHDEHRAGGSDPYAANGEFIAAANPAAIKSLIASAREAAAEIERLRSALGAAEGRATDYRTVAINQGWNWTICDRDGREEYAKHRGEHVDACALNAAEARARAAQMDGEG